MDRRIYIEEPSPFFKDCERQMIEKAKSKPLFRKRRFTWLMQLKSFRLSCMYDFRNALMREDVVIEELSDARAIWKRVFNHNSFQIEATSYGSDISLRPCCGVPRNKSCKPDCYLARR